MHKRSGQYRLLRLLGPAFVAAVAYVDPGNVAANLTAGAQYGYLLVWVLVTANIMAMLVQYLSAKLGIVTGKSLPDILGERMSKAPRISYWIQAELVAIATDLAEVIGGALALYLLFGTPLLLSGFIVGAISIGLLLIRDYSGAVRFEQTITLMLVIITVGFVLGLFYGNTDWAATAGGLIPRFKGTETVLLAASMLGATVMPHAIYAHSALVADRDDINLKVAASKLLRATRVDVFISLVVAGSVNIAMLLLAAGNLSGAEGTDSIQGAYQAITAALGPVVGVAFGIGLLASGLASTSVGAYSGQVVMGGLLHWKVSLLTRRLITLVPALVIIGIGVNPTWALVLSQVFLSVGIPFALVPLVKLTADREIMGNHVNPRWLTTVAWVIAGLIIALNLALILLLGLGIG